MAFIARTGTPIGSGEHYFNVSHSVGAGGKNYWTDIMLAQYLINKIYMMEHQSVRIRDLTAVQRSSLPNPMTDYKNLKLTEKWVRIFQEDYKSIVDGRVDTAPKGNLYALKKSYTIWWLNHEFRHYHLIRYGGIENVLTDVAMPVMLKNELKKTLPTSGG